MSGKTVKLPEYHHDRLCPKCGEKDIYNSFRPKGYRLDQCFGDPFAEADQDLIRRYCRNCQYKWSERIKDASNAS